MKLQRNKYFILNYLFICCLLALLVNDHFLKYACPGWFVGKLSDMAGIVLLPLLLAYIWPGWKPLAIIVVSALLFTFWKLPLSQGLLDLYNDFALIPVSRVVDYTDLIVLLLLPVPWYILQQPHTLNHMRIEKCHPIIILLPAIAGLMATSPPKNYYYTKSDGNLKCYKCDITVDYRQEEIVEKLKRIGIIFDSIAPVDSIAYHWSPGLKNQEAHVYRLNRLIIDNDTLRDLDFTMRTLKNGNTKIYFNGMNVSADISTVQLERKLRKYYKELLFKTLKNELKD